MFVSTTPQIHRGLSMMCTFHTFSFPHVYHVSSNCSSYFSSFPPALKVKDVPSKEPCNVCNVCTGLPGGTYKGFHLVHSERRRDRRHRCGPSHRNWWWHMVTQGMSWDKLREETTDLAKTCRDNTRFGIAFPTFSNDSWQVKLCWTNWNPKRPYDWPSTLEVKSSWWRPSNRPCWVLLSGEFVSPVFLLSPAKTWIRKQINWTQWI